MKALILNNEVVDLVDAEFEVHESMTWMDAPDGCAVGWVLDNGILKDANQKTPEEIAAAKLANLRMVRNRKLRNTDWRFRSDLTVSQEWIDYCQALRDITNTYTSLEDVVWPVKPE